MATVNELAAPVDRPIQFRLTSSSVMNAFYVPTLAGMIYAMPSMETKLHAVINHPGNYAGFSLEKPTENSPVMRFASVTPGLFDAVVGQCVAPGTNCLGAIKQMPNMPTPKVAKPALTGGDAGEAPPKNPRDVQQRSNASPSDPTTL